MFNGDWVISILDKSHFGRTPIPIKLISKDKIEKIGGSIVQKK